VAGARGQWRAVELAMLGWSPAGKAQAQFGRVRGLRPRVGAGFIGMGHEWGTTVMFVQGPRHFVPEIRSCLHPKVGLSLGLNSRQNPCQIMSPDFGLVLNFPKVCLRYFGATLSIRVCGFEFWYTVIMFGFVRGAEK
jgi:hypothetical protein